MLKSGVTVFKQMLNVGKYDTPDELVNVVSPASILCCFCTLTGAAVIGVILGFKFVLSFRVEYRLILLKNC